MMFEKNVFLGTKCKKTWVMLELVRATCRFDRLYKGGTPNKF